MRQGWTPLLALLLLMSSPPASASMESEDKRDSVEPSTPAKGAEQSVPLSRDAICGMIESAANKEALPLSFFARLIWRESRFNPQAVSSAGAQGVAQFMPKTANGRGLKNPFDPFSALMESAEYLRELLHQFGNLGLAAAAYNAGPKRIQDWLAKRGPPLKKETHDYVEIITGRSATDWAKADASISIEEPKDFRCAQTAKFAAERLPVIRLSDELSAWGAHSKPSLRVRAAPALRRNKGNETAPVSASHVLQASAHSEVGRNRRLPTGEKATRIAVINKPFANGRDPKIDRVLKSICQGC